MPRARARVSRPRGSGAVPESWRSPSGAAPERFRSRSGAVPETVAAVTMVLQEKLVFGRFVDRARRQLRRCSVAYLLVLAPRRRVHQLHAGDLVPADQLVDCYGL